MVIKIGDVIPKSVLNYMDDKGSMIKDDDFFTNKVVLLFAVPGAFTPTCSNQHLPGFIQNVENFHAKKIDTVACLSVNDAFVMDAWGKQAGASGKIVMLADGNATLTSKMGLTMDGSSFGMGMRSLRYAMLIRHGVVEQLQIEENLGDMKLSRAENMLNLL